MPMQPGGGLFCLGSAKHGESLGRTLNSPSICAYQPCWVPPRPRQGTERVLWPAG
jgi:hypothetical protein